MHTRGCRGVPYRQPDTAQTAPGQTLAGYPRPALAVVMRFVDARGGSHRWHEVTQPRPLPVLPGRGVEVIRIIRVASDVDSAGVVADVQGSRPALAAISGPEYAAL